jgi:hypothetical protein
MEIITLVDRQTRQNPDAITTKIRIKSKLKQLIPKHDKSKGSKKLFAGNNQPISKKLNIFQQRYNQLIPIIRT